MKYSKGEVLYRFLKKVAKPIFYTKFNIEEGDYVLPEDGQPFILVGHHVSSFDPIIISAFSRRLIRFLYTDANRRLPIRSLLLRKLDMIPFAKNSADFKSIRQIKKRLEHGQAVGIFPEGGASWDGRTDVLIESTAKLIKMMGVPVYGITYNGAYLSKPRWSKETRRGQVVLNSYVILDKEAISKMTHEKIHARLTKLLQYDEFGWQNDVMMEFKGKDLAERIERLLYCCPKCNAFNTILSHQNTFECTGCGKRFEYDVYGRILDVSSGAKGPFILNIPQWNSWQREALRKLILDDADLPSQLFGGGAPLHMTGIRLMINGRGKHVEMGFDGERLFLQHPSNRRIIPLRT